MELVQNSVKYSGLDPEARRATGRNLKLLHKLAMEHVDDGADAAMAMNFGWGADDKGRKRD